MKIAIIRKVLVGILFACCFFSIGSVAEAKKCNFKKKAIPASIEAWSNKHARNHPPTTKFKSKDILSANKTVGILYYSWRSFGYNIKKANANAIANMRQATIESTRRPNARQAVCDKNGCPGDRGTTGGLFQLTPALFDKWALPGMSNRFAPLDNALAVVNAQVNGKIRKINSKDRGSILSGKGGWSVSGKNPCR